MLSSRLFRATYNNNNVNVSRSKKRFSEATNSVKSARAARRNQPAPQPSKASGSSTGNILAGVGLTTAVLIGYVIYDIDANPNGVFGNFYRSIGAEGLVKWIQSQVASQMNQVMQPSVDKLIPDFPNIDVYGPTPPGATAPPLLVVDLEKTLVGSYYGKKRSR